MRQTNKDYFVAAAQFTATASRAAMSPDAWLLVLCALLQFIPGVVAIGLQASVYVGLRAFKFTANSECLDDYGDANSSECQSSSQAVSVASAACAAALSLLGVVPVCFGIMIAYWTFIECNNFREELIAPGLKRLVFTCKVCCIVVLVFSAAGFGAAAGSCDSLRHARNVLPDETISTSSTSYRDSVVDLLTEASNALSGCLFPLLMYIALGALSLFTLICNGNEDAHANPQSTSMF